MTTKTIYLIRHGEANKKNGKKYCLGRTDFPLTENGRMQALQLKDCFIADKFDKIYCSSLRRSRETAEIIGAGKKEICELDGIEEMSAGDWDGLDFDTIKEKWAHIYAARGEDNSLIPPGGESFAHGSARMENAIRKLAACGEVSDEVVIVGHSTIIRSLICSLMGISYEENWKLPQPYCGITILEAAEDKMVVKKTGILPENNPTEAEIKDLWESYDVSLRVRRHMSAVADVALRLAQKAKEKISFDTDAIYAAAMLHDLCRGETRHEEKAAEVLRRLGYFRVANIVRSHNGLGFTAEEDFSEEMLVFLADKMVYEDKKVGLEQRFLISAEKCKTQDAKKAHKMRYKQAATVESKYKKAIGLNTDGLMDI